MGREKKLCKSWNDMKKHLYRFQELRRCNRYIPHHGLFITVNANILADSGATCSFHDCSTVSGSSPPGPECVLGSNPGYEECLARVKKDLVVATLSAMVGSLAMGLFANLPFGLAPGMGANAHIAYNVVGFRGSGSISYHTAMAIVLLEGCAFLAVSALGLRGKLACLIPQTVRLACTVDEPGHWARGTGKVNSSDINRCAETDSVTGTCLGGKMKSPTFWLAVVGTSKGSMIYGIVFVTAVSWIRGTQIQSTLGAISFTEFRKSEVWVAFATLFYVDLLGTTGVLYTMAEIGGFVEDGNRRRLLRGGIGARVTTTATFVESSAGLKEGGKTGLTAVIVGVYFLASMFLTPLVTNVPRWAVGPSLVMVGVMMMGVVKDIRWGEIKEAVTAFVTILLMPLTYSIANGIIAGIGIYLALSMYDVVLGVAKLLNGVRKRVMREHNQVSSVATV
ncbi:hypothetical protein ARALYDRAFT_489598 [Arabidopsis lyrata subsp. lyrata]|uniref:Xanthine/uracil permease family protein n=1 Tax=Arabidopsis lyrata subsp. lyrata TaxID=81972 RepID=D7M669_ARALL|nr:hypothetical protein ARALYDRAFT_489598 [Arabidopsis lyrata subsp. lyrata]